MPTTKLLAVTALLIGLSAIPATSQQPAAPAAPAATPAAPPAAPPAYGTPINLEAAKKAMAASEAEAAKNNWPVAIAILDSAGHIVLLQRQDNTQYGSIQIAIDKAKTSVDFRRPSKAFEDVIAGGGAGLRVLAIRAASPLEGGVPIIVDGKLVGAIGVSGVTSQQDAQVARAGIAAIGGK
jgi:glc operon protein GlcG